MDQEDANCLAYQSSNTQLIDLKGQFAMPGFIEGHGHFSGVGRMAKNLNFLGTKSWAAILQQIADKKEEYDPGSWIEGRGWHQEKVGFSASI